MQAEENTANLRMKDIKYLGNGKRRGVARSQGIWEEHKTRKGRRVTTGLAKHLNFAL